MLRDFTYYEDHRGHAPVEEFIKKLPAIEQKQLVAKLSQLRVFPVLGYPHYLQFIGYALDIGELRLGPFRIFVHRISPTEYLMVHAFRKRTAATPAQEVVKAVNRIQDFLEQSSNE